MSDNLSKLFGLDPLKHNLPQAPKEDKDLNGDAEEVKQNIKDLIATGNKALAEALDLAIQSESPRAYEVLTNLINSLAELNMRVVDVYDKKATITKKTSQPNRLESPQIHGDGAVVNNTTNIVFEGTTAELSQYLKKLNKPAQDVFENEPKQD
jgi:hypothetical protein